MLEKNKSGEKFFTDVNECLDRAGFMMYGVTLVEASLIVGSTPQKIRRVNVIWKCMRQ